VNTSLITPSGRIRWLVTQRGSMRWERQRWVLRPSLTALRVRPNLGMKPAKQLWMQFCMLCRSRSGIKFRDQRSLQCAWIDREAEICSIDREAAGVERYAEGKPRRLTFHRFDSQWSGQGQISLDHRAKMTDMSVGRGKLERRATHSAARHVGSRRSRHRCGIVQAWSAGWIGSVEHG